MNNDTLANRPRQITALDDTICNQVTGQVIRFLQTRLQTYGRLLEMECKYPPLSAEPPIHYHPAQDEYFRVISGMLNVRIDRQVNIYKAGDEFTVVRGIAHSMWNAGRSDTIVNWRVTPARGTEAFLRQLTRLANDGKTNNAGVPAIALMIYLLKQYADTIRLQKLPAGMVNGLFILFTPFYGLKRFRIRYPKG